MSALQDRLSLNRSAPEGCQRGPDRRIVASLVFALALVGGWRDGGFWHAEAAAIAVIAGLLLVASLLSAPNDRRSIFVVASLGLLAVWWGVRSVTAGAGTDFLPLGASIIAFAAAFAAVRALAGQAREQAALAMACLGAVGALVGFAGLIWRSLPLAIPAQSLWRLSSTLTYADAAGLACGVCLFLALGCSRPAALVRVAICLNMAGLLATQSRGAYLAVACASLLVPARRYRKQAVPLTAGVALGVAAIASSPQRGPVPWLAAVVVLAILTATSKVHLSFRDWAATHSRTIGWTITLAAAVAIALLVHHEISLRTLAPSDQDRWAEWSAALRQWASSLSIGVGPDRPLVLHAADGSVAHFAHNEYLQIGADAGIIGLGLLGLVGVSLGRTLRRTSQLSSCAVAALVCWAMGGLFDFTWHLPALGLLGGWCAGLAAESELVL